MLQFTPKQAVHVLCRECMQSTRDAAIEGCGGTLVYSTGKPCPIYPYRLGAAPPVRALRAFCLECMGGSPGLVRDCDRVECPAHGFRFGKSPARTGIGGRVKSGVQEPFQDA